MWQFFFNLLFSSSDIKLKKITGFYLQTEVTFFLFFRDLKTYKEVLKLQIFKCLLDLAIVKTSIFLKKELVSLY